MNTGETGLSNDRRTRSPTTRNGPDPCGPAGGAIRRSRIDGNAAGLRLTISRFISKV
jgi:hypothetical protein